MTVELDSAEAPNPRNAPGVIGLGRRRLLRGGLGAAPVLMSLASGPVGAAACIQASAFASLHASGKQPNLPCDGLNTATWFLAPESQWPLRSDSKFSQPFSPSLTDTKATLRQVVNPNGGYDPVARQLVAALLNTSANPPLTPASILTPATVKSIWTSYASRGYYEPTAGVRWTGTRIVEWILTTFA